MLYTCVSCSAKSTCVATRFTTRTSLKSFESVQIEHLKLNLCVHIYAVVLLLLLRIVGDMRSLSTDLCPLGPPEHPCMNSTLKHVFSMWPSGLGVWARTFVSGCLRRCLIRELYDLAHSFLTTLLFLSWPSECMFTYVEINEEACVSVCQLICIRQHSRGLSSCWFSATCPEGCKSG